MRGSYCTVAPDVDPTRPNSKIDQVHYYPAACRSADLNLPFAPELFYVPRKKSNLGPLARFAAVPPAINPVHAL